MPNWCSNQIEISGDTAEMKIVQNIICVEEGEYSLTNLYPMPEILEGTTSPSARTETFDEDGRYMSYVNDPDNDKWTMDTWNEWKARHEAQWESSKVCIEQTGYANWYDWANADENWGTKWGDCETDLTFSVNHVWGRYETAWCPLGAEFWVKVTKEYPSLRVAVSYVEEGMGFEGAMSIHNGEVYYDETTDASMHMSSAMNALPQDDEVLNKR